MTPVISGPENLTMSADMTLCTVDKQLCDAKGRGVTEYMKTPNKASLLTDASRSGGRGYTEKAKKADEHQ